MALLLLTRPSGTGLEGETLQKLSLWWSNRKKAIPNAACDNDFYHHIKLLGLQVPCRLAALLEACLRIVFEACGSYGRAALRHCRRPPGFAYKIDNPVILSFTSITVEYLDSHLSSGQATARKQKHNFHKNQPSNPNPKP
ncbi:hypothetical protein FH972_022212 [Carpinus fangiana]|uniref:Uncharacterized protein n=1 Tax=Carpinus fangiana TaxID=176857 RepID=A0A5N6KS50_9ROSI|nr:hypothetical protein FH972_022212 [Carpinus fangiana]